MHACTSETDLQTIKEKNQKGVFFFNKKFYCY